MVDELSKESVVTDVASDLQDQGLSAAAGDRSRHGGPAGHCDGRRGQHALRRLRPAPGVHHLYPAQPVPRGDGGRAELPDRSGDAEQSLREVGQRHAGSAEHAGALGTGARATFDRPPGTVPVDGRELQPGAGQGAGRCGEGRARASSSASRCRPASTPASRARRRRSRPRWPTSRS